MKISNCNGVTIKRATSEGLYLAYKDLAKSARAYLEMMKK